MKASRHGWQQIKVSWKPSCSVQQQIKVSWKASCNVQHQIKACWKPSCNVQQQIIVKNEIKRNKPRKRRKHGGKLL